MQTYGSGSGPTLALFCAANGASEDKQLTLVYPAAPCHRNYTHVPVTSVSLPVDPSGHYEGFAHFVSFAERIK